MIYLKAEDNDAGVQVEECGSDPHHSGNPADLWLMAERGSGWRVSPEMARAVCEGLLRWMLEKDGPGTTAGMFARICAEWRDTQWEKSR